MKCTATYPAQISFIIALQGQPDYFYPMAEFHTKTRNILLPLSAAHSEQLTRSSVVLWACVICATPAEVLFVHSLPSIS